MEKKARILYVEDDLTLSYVTRDNLEIRGYSVDFCEDGLMALEMMKGSVYDLCILDVMLPKMDGFTLAGKIRETNPGIPILFLTARSGREDRITGLKLGGDDYITKPFNIEELVLKVEVFLKRRNIIQGPEAQKKHQQKLGAFIYDYRNQQLMLENKAEVLTHRENELLNFLFMHQGQILKREDILKHVWGNDDFFVSRSLDVFISRLRKILKPDPQTQIENIHNTGYRLKTGSNESA
ncbi:MAG: response regulator transcription factor [Bacteroidota bacterium]